jgi:hypothetical protein
MEQHSIKIKRGEVVCGRKGLLAVGERGTVLNHKTVQIVLRLFSFLPKLVISCYYNDLEFFMIEYAY